MPETTKNRQECLYHCRPRHWNTLELDDSLPTKLVLELIDHSYDLVVASLSKKRTG